MNPFKNKCAIPIIHNKKSHIVYTIDKNKTSIEFIEKNWKKYKDYQDDIVREYKPNEEFVTKYCDLKKHIHRSVIVQNCLLSEEFIELLLDFLVENDLIYSILKTQNVSEDFFKRKFRYYHNREYYTLSHAYYLLNQEVSDEFADLILDLKLFDFNRIRFFHLKRTKDNVIKKLLSFDVRFFDLLDNPSEEIKDFYRVLTL